MDIKDICEKIQVRDEQVKAYLLVRLQKNMDCRENFRKVIASFAISYAQNLAETFLNKNKEFFMNDENRKGVFAFLTNLKADKPNSGNLFSEEFYKMLRVFENQNCGEVEKQ
ncbi:MAG: hypothetical protein J6K97_03345 [Clostridia bacterium]|nr:hypothetical protein [Clostridia bacterium]